MDIERIIEKAQSKKDLTEEEKALLIEHYDKEAGRLLLADKKTEQQQEADRVGPYIEADLVEFRKLRKTAADETELSAYDITERQFLAWDWFCRWGIPQEIAAEKMSISQPAFGRLLKRLLERHPDLKPQPRMIKTQDGIPPSAYLFGDREYVAGEKQPFHIPGKTKWPKVELKFDKADERREQRRLKKITRQAEEPEMQPKTDLGEALDQCPNQE